jgi:hypothetical protein
MIDPYQFEERICICIESGMSLRNAERVAAKQFFESCNLPTERSDADAQLIGWSKLKMFRTMNQEGLKEWIRMK